MVSSSFPLWWSGSIAGCYNRYLGLEPRRKSRTLFLLNLRLFLILRTSGLDEGCGGFAEKFGWRRVRGREEWMSPLTFLGVFVGLDRKTSGRSRSEEDDAFQKRK